MGSAQTLKCPNCGAPAAADASRCDHCGAQLATVACPSCFSLNFVGAKFCSHCGAHVTAQDASSASAKMCPRCKIAMNAVVIGASNLVECPKCEGIWADTETLRQICADQEKQAAVLGLAAPLPQTDEHGIEQNIHYIPCPVCHALMNRVNFAHCSHVVVNVCAKHGTWFDRDELRQIVKFIRSGGLEQARAREMADLEEERRMAQAAKLGSTPGNSFEDYRFSSHHDAISAAADVLRGLFGW